MSAVAPPVSPHHHSHGPANRRRRVLPTAAPLFVEEPSGPVRGGVIVLHDIFGLTDYIEHYCRLLAQSGWLAVAPYHYYDVGGREYSDVSTALAALGRLSTRGLTDDVAAGLAYLTERRGLDNRSVAVLGFSMGAHLAAWAASRWELAATVSVGPGRRHPAPVRELPSLADLVRARRTPWLGVLGARDGGLFGAGLADLKAAAHSDPVNSGRAVPARIQLVPGADQDFYRESSSREPGANPAQLEMPGWRNIRRFLADDR